MAKGLEETLLALLADPGAVAAQADIAQAAALARQELSFRQRAGAAAFQLRQARAEGADEAEIAELQARLAHRTARLDAARRQTAAADLKRPFPDAKLAQVFGRADGGTDKPPLTAAVLTAAGGEVAARAVLAANGTFHLTAQGDLTGVVVQVSDAGGGVLWRSATPVDIPAGTVLYVDVALKAPEPEPGPVPAEPQMPDLVGQDEGVAQALLARLGVSKVDVVDKIAEGLPGIVIEQAPGAGTPLKTGAKVALTVRRASADTPVPTFLPGLVGRPVAEAVATLKTLGLGASVRRQPDDGPADIVLDQSPKEGTLLKDVTSVDLTVSEAREVPPETTLVPDLVGKPLELARELLKATDLKPAISETEDPAAPAGVIGQDPAAGTPVPRKSVVKIVVNTPPQVEPGLAVVPQVVGTAGAKAEKLLSTLGLKAETKTEGSTAPEGDVIGQDPAAEVRVKTGSTVTLTVSAGKPSGPPDTKALIAAMARDPRAREAKLTPARLTSLFEAAGITSLDAARALSASTVRDLRSRLSLTAAPEATAFRAALQAALKALG